MNAWIFDVDGVLTDPQEKKIVDQEIFIQLIKKLKSGEAVSLNTGRSLDFINKEVLDPLEKLIEVKSILNHMFAVGEKGGVWIYYENGEKISSFDHQLKPPKKLKGEIKSLIETEFSDFMVFDDTKKTMISTEIKNGINLHDYAKKQTKLVEKLGSLIVNYKNLKIDKSIIAVDIDYEKMGKDTGIKKFLEMAKNHGIDPEEYYAFGDSESDLAMINELENNQKKVTFIFVGGNLENENVIKTTSRYYQGTLEYLKNFK